MLRIVKEPRKYSSRDVCDAKIKELTDKVKSGVGNCEENGNSRKRKKT